MDTVPPRRVIRLMLEEIQQFGVRCQQVTNLADHAENLKDHIRRMKELNRQLDRETLQQITALNEALGGEKDG